MIRKLKIFVMTFLQICDYFVRIPMFYYHLYFNNIVKKQLYNIFEIPVFAAVTNDIKTTNLCLNKGQPLVVTMPKTQIAKDINSLAKKIISQSQ